MRYDDANRDQRDWGPWVDHRPGRPRLTVGMVFQPVLSLLHWDNLVVTLPSTATDSGLSHDIWLNKPDDDYAVVKYRVLPPTSLHILRASVENLANNAKLDDFCGMDFGNILVREG